MTIREGKIEDAPFLAKVVMGALGPELCIDLAGGEDRLPLVDEVFTRLASNPRSQYSYMNSMIATSDDGMPIGGIIAYDGSELRVLRKAFIQTANEVLGWNVTEQEAEKWGDEAQPDEIYIDSLYVLPEYRNKGVASALLDGVKRRFAGVDKHFGLLVEPDNDAALKTYSRWGFKRVGISNFFRAPMIHMQMG